jgi:23S rRNA pseudouridine1911/1915/1917 synthase
VKTRTRESRPQREARPPEPTVAAVVRDQRGVSWSRARALCKQGRVTVNGEQCLDPALRLTPGAAVVVDERAPKHRTAALPESAIVFSDRDVVVVDKPAGMLSIPYEPGDKDTLLDCTRILLRRTGGHGFRRELGVVHRLDKETSGLMVFARALAAKRILEAQFRAHDIERVYQAIAHGIVTAKRIETHLILDRGDGLRGSYGLFRRPRGGIPPDAKRSITYVRPIAPLAGATLVECRLETGRQHQIRIHLSEIGHPLVGERVYIRDYAGRKIESARPMLHARVLGFAHPRTGRWMSFEREAPEDFRAMIESLRLTPGGLR